MHEADHGLRQCRDELYALLKRWLPEKLRAAEEMPPLKVPRDTVRRFNRLFGETFPESLGQQQS